MKQSNAARGWHRFLFFAMMLGVAMIFAGIGFESANLGLWGFMTFVGACFLLAIEVMWKGANL